MAFQLSDRYTERRLRDVAPECRPPEIEVLSQSHEKTQMPQLNSI
jgi:hypothetical protein